MEETHTFEALGSQFRVDKKYAPIKALGKGAFGVVCACKNRETGAKVAVKKTTPMAATQVDAKHALRELRLLRWLGKHPNIVSLKDIMVDLELDTLYVVMELMDTDLHRIIVSTQPLGDAHYKHFMYQLLRGLRYAHSYGVIHRDLKPANLLVTKNCDLVISDFGLARQVPDATEAVMTEHVVTRWYRAPELMLSADGHYDQSVDMWSTGCVFAELLGRTPLFAGKDFMETVSMQISVLGTRPPAELAYIKSDQALQFLAAMPYKPTVPWSTLYPDASDKALDLLDKLLQFHPSKRITAEAAMAHPYFDSVRAQYVDPEPVLPLGPGGFEFSFESDPSLTVDDFRRLIVEEAASLRAEKALARRLRAEKVATATAAHAPHAAGYPPPTAGGISGMEDEPMDGARRKAPTAAAFGMVGDATSRAGGGVGGAGMPSDPPMAYRTASTGVAGPMVVEGHRDASRGDSKLMDEGGDTVFGAGSNYSKPVPIPSGAGVAHGAGLPGAAGARFYAAGRGGGSSVRTATAAGGGGGAMRSVGGAAAAMASGGVMPHNRGARVG